MTRQMDNKQFVTDTVCEYIDNTFGLYDTLQGKLRMGLYLQRETLSTSFFATLTGDAKHYAKSQENGLDLRNFSPILMAQFYHTEFKNFKEFQRDMSMSIQKYVGCFLSMPFVEFLQGKRKLTFDQLIDTVTMTVILLDDLTYLLPTTKEMAEIVSLKHFCYEWQRWARWKQTGLIYKATKKSSK